MKNLIALALVLLPFAVHSKVIVPAKTLKVNSPDGLTNIKDLKATLSISCKYKAGIFWPESKSCGYTKQDLTVNDGLISIPQIETFNKASYHAQLSKNYDISISVSEGTTHLATLAVYEKEGFKAMANNTRDLNILRFNPAIFAVAVDGQDFFGSDLAKEKDAYVLLSISSSAKKNSLDDILLSSSLTHYLWSAENRNLYAGKGALKDMKDIKMPATVLAYLGEESNLALKVNLSYAINAGVHTVKYEARVSVPAQTNALAAIGTLELKAKK